MNQKKPYLLFFGIKKRRFFLFLLQRGQILHRLNRIERIANDKTDYFRYCADL